MSENETTHQIVRGPDDSPGPSIIDIDKTSKGDRFTVDGKKPKKNFLRFLRHEEKEEIDKTLFKKSTLEVKEKSKDSKEEKNERKFWTWFSHFLRDLSKRTWDSDIKPIGDWNSWKSWVKSRQFLYAWKSTLALMIGCVFAFVPVLESYLGSLTLLILVAIILFDMTVPPVTAIEIGLFLTVLSFATHFMAGVALYSSITHPFGLAFWLAFLTLLLSWLRGSVELKFVGSCIMCSFALIITIIYGARSNVFTVDFPFKTALNIVIGTWIAVIVNVFVFPVKIPRLLSEEAISSFLLIRCSLRSFDVFFDKSSAKEEEEMVKKKDGVKGKITAIHKLSLSFKYEFLYGFYSPEEHLRTMEYYQELLSMSLRLISASQLSHNVRDDPKVREILSKLEGPFSIFSKRTENAIATLLKYVEKGGTDIPHFTNEINESLAEFHPQIEGILAEGIENNRNSENWEENFVIYFYISAYREFAVRLAALQRHLVEKRRERRTFFFPIAWKNRWNSLKGLFGNRKNHQKHSKTNEDLNWAQNARKKSRKMARKVLNPFYSDAFLFGVKIAIAVWLTSLPEWIENSSSWFASVRGEWAVISVAIVFTPHFGSSLLNATWRITGTIIGAVFVALEAAIFGINIWGITIVLILLAFPSFNVKVSTRPHSKVAVLAMVTYTAVALVKWQRRDDPTYYTIWHLVYLRPLLISIGVIIALIVDRFLWPSLARDKLTLTLSRSIHSCSRSYGQVVTALVSDERIPNMQGRLSQAEIAIRDSLTCAEGLCNAVTTELTIHESIPVHKSREIIAILHRILSDLVTMRICVQDNLCKEVRQVLVDPANTYRREMASLTLVLFWICAEVLASKALLPQCLPDPLKVREKMIKKIKKIDVVGNGIATNHTTDLMKYYTFVIASKQVHIELESLITSLVSIYGEEISIMNLFEKDEIPRFPFLPQNSSELVNSNESINEEKGLSSVNTMKES